MKRSNIREWVIGSISAGVVSFLFWKLKKERSELRNKLKRESEKNTDYKSKIKNLSERLKNASDLSNKLDTEFQMGKRETSRLKEEFGFRNSRLEEMKKDLEVSLQQSKDEKLLSDAEVRKIRQQYEKLKQKYSNVVTRKEVLERELTDNKRQLMVVEKHLENEKRAFKDLSQRSKLKFNTEVKQLAERYKSDIKELKFDMLEKHSEELEKFHKLKTTEKQDLKKQIELLQSSSEKFQKVINKMEQKYGLDMEKAKKNFQLRLQQALFEKEKVVNLTLNSLKEKKEELDLKNKEIEKLRTDSKVGLSKYTEQRMKDSEMKISELQKLCDELRENNTVVVAHNKMFINENEEMKRRMAEMQKRVQPVNEIEKKMTTERKKMEKRFQEEAEKFKKEIRNLKREKMRLWQVSKMNDERASEFKGMYEKKKEEALKLNHTIEGLRKIEVSYEKRRKGFQEELMKKNREIEDIQRICNVQIKIVKKVSEEKIKEKEEVITKLRTRNIHTQQKVLSLKKRNSKLEESLTIEDGKFFDTISI